MTTGAAGTRPADTAVADQRATGEQLAGTVDQLQDVVLDGLQRRGVGRPGAQVAARTRVEQPHELVVKRRRVRAERPISLGMRAERGGDTRRHLVGAGRNQRRRRKRRGGVWRR